MSQLVAGDTAPTRMIFRVGGVPVDITGYGFTIKIGYQTPLVKSAIVTNAAAGEFEFRWSAQDLIAGRYAAEIMITYPDGTTRTQKLGGGLEILARIA